MSPADVLTVLRIEALRLRAAKAAIDAGADEAAEIRAALAEIAQLSAQLFAPAPPAPNA